MKKMITLTLASALFMPPLFLHAEENHHPKEQGVKDAPVMCEHMQEMMRQMEEIRKTDDPVKRDKLMQEHMQSMHESMAMHQDSEKMGCADQEVPRKKAKMRHKDHRKSK